MKILVTGASGLLGADVADYFKEQGNEVKALMGRKDVDIRDLGAIRQAIVDFKPEVVVHCAGFRDLDYMELHEKESFEINALGTRNVTLACKEIGAKLVYISSDTVYNGEKQTPYHEYDMPCPVNIYGKTKLAAENVVKELYDKHFIIRTAWLFGFKGHVENNFILGVINNIKNGNSINATTDQICCPSYTHDIAMGISKMIETDCYGTYLLTNKGTASRYDVNVKVAKLAGLDTNMVKPVLSTNAHIAKRSKNTVFDSINYASTFGDVMPDWNEAIERCFADMKKVGII